MFSLIRSVYLSFLPSLYNEGSASSFLTVLIGITPAGRSRTLAIPGIPRN